MNPLDQKTLEVWSNGGGTQSACIAAMIESRRLPKPDICAIVDTHYECGSTWTYWDNVVRPAMENIGVRCFRIPSNDFRTGGIYGKNGDLLLPAFTRQSGSLSKLPTFCSKEWKWRVLQRWMKSQGIETANVWMGISWDEIYRMKDSDCSWITKKYPLIETVRTRRWECEQYVMSHGWPKPPRSRCKMCPNQKSNEWRSLTESEKTEAIDIEKMIRDKDEHAYLHFSGKPLQESINDDPYSNEMELFGTCDGGHCFV